MEPVHPQGSWFLRIIFMVLAGGVIFGGYYGYCWYRAGQRVYALSQEAQDIHQALMRLTKNINAEDIRGVVIKMAEKAQVKWNPQRIEVLIEPMNETNVKMLPAPAQMAMGIAAKIPQSSAARGSKSTTGTWIVGFKGQFLAKHGIYKRVFEIKRYTWFKWVAKPDKGE